MVAIFEKNQYFQFRRKYLNYLLSLSPSNSRSYYLQKAREPVY